ncbi:LamG-like jellyroll fold domain-containing protein [Rurimicrobium arvi]|uniref:Por secretion system C-terminal sorting domain-containing protein n=1 Tax=Rurimicrobium arvi TaxID=2049916 RepID=A0ABP8MVB5_9BACT
MKTTVLSLFCIVNSFALLAQVDLNKGLMLYLPFKGNTLDASPNANHALNFGATLTSDQWGNPNSAYQFNGVDNYMRIPNDATLQCDAQITICARVNVGGFYNGTCYGNSIVDKGSPDYISGSYSLRFHTSISGGDCNVQDSTKQNYYGQFYNEIPSEAIRNNPPYIIKGQWDCLVYIFDGATAKMYVNGVLRHSFATATSIGTNTQDLFLGKHDNTSYPYWFNGAMDEIRIYNRALNTLEIDSVCSEANPQLSIRELKDAEVLPLLSNPVRNELVLGLNNRDMGGVLTITDLSGRTLLQIARLDRQQVAVDHLAAGMYLVTYQTDDVLMRVKVIKQ